MRLTWSSAAPAAYTRPLLGRSRPPSSASSVDLPPPDGPVMATNSPGATSNDTCSSAATCTSPDLNRRLTSSTRRPSGWPRRSHVSALIEAAERAGRTSGTTNGSSSGSGAGGAAGAGAGEGGVVGREVVRGGGPGSPAGRGAPIGARG